MARLCSLAIFIYLLVVVLYAIAADEIIQQKKGTGNCDRPAQFEEGSRGLGVKEIERTDGGKDRIYYSITTPEEETKHQQEEKEKMEKSLEMLRNIIIDNRKK